MNEVKAIGTENLYHVPKNPNEDKSKYNTITNSLFDVWSNQCADSISDIDSKTGKMTYAKDVPDFDMVGDEFRNDIKNNGGVNAGKIYKEKAAEIAKNEIAVYDKNGDGAIDPSEALERDLKDAMDKYGTTDKDFCDNISQMSVRKSVFMDLNKDGKIDDKEYTSFMYAMDSNNEKNEANGKISRDEYAKTSSYFEKAIDNESGAFRGKMRACYKSLFGYDPAAAKNE